MYKRKLEPDIRCPLEYGLEIFGGKWNSRIICVLAAKNVLRYSELRREMGNITDAVLASTLKSLIANGIVSRKSYDEIPPRVEYALSEKGKSVVPILRVFARGRVRFSRQIRRVRWLSARNATTNKWIMENYR